ncbi:MAG: energy transducer TonB, partial [Flavobacteriales bacterium]|nr:energy transducer TonB [Flavobacteriales bacterium]
STSEPFPIEEEPKISTYIPLDELVEEDLAEEKEREVRRIEEEVAKVEYDKKREERLLKLRKQDEKRIEVAERLRNEQKKEREIRRIEEETAKIKKTTERLLAYNKKIVNYCDSSKNFYPFDKPANLNLYRSNTISERVIIFDTLTDDFETWNMYLEALQLHNGKFRYHKRVEKVVVRCFVDNKGKIMQMKILENTSKNYRYEKIAEKLMLSLDFIPGIKDNKTICMWISVPVIFSKRR